jgi:hypothetical protein
VYKYINRFPTSEEIPKSQRDNLGIYLGLYWFIEYTTTSSPTIVELLNWEDGDETTLYYCGNDESCNEEDIPHPFMLIGPVLAPDEVVSWSKMDENLSNTGKVWGKVTRTYDNKKYSCSVIRGSSKADVLMTLSETETEEVFLTTSSIGTRDRFVLAQGWKEDPPIEEWR